MIKAIVFDFGNVIAFFDHRLTTNRLASHAGLSADEVHAYVFGGQLETDYDSGRISTAEYLRQVRETCQLRCADDMLHAAVADIFWPNHEVIALLPRLQPRYRLVLASNTNEIHARQFRRQFAQALAHFHAQALSYEIGACKPQAAFFEHCRRLADSAPAECVFVDDMPANVAGARACGFEGIVYTGFEDLSQRLAALGVQADALPLTPARSPL